MKDEKITLEILKNPREEETFLHSLHTWNRAKESIDPKLIDGNQKFSLTLRTESGEAVAGITGRIQFNVMYGDLFWSAAKHRRKGYGKRIYQEMLAYGRENGCTDFVCFTYSFYDLLPILDKVDPELKVSAQIENAPEPHKLVLLHRKL